MPNFSEGRDLGLVAALGAGPAVLDVHADADHHRCVVTMAGAEVGPLADAVFEKLALAVERIDLRAHAGVHPRVGAVDVVPFVPLGSASMADAVAAAHALAERAWRELRVPAYLYADAAGDRRLADVRSGRARPDFGDAAHPTAGWVCVGARPPLVAYNVAFAGLAEDRVQEMVASMRRLPGVQALAFRLSGGRVQLSMNLTRAGPGVVLQAYERAVELAGRPGQPELVGLCPAVAAGPGCDGGVLEARLAAAVARSAAAAAAAAGATGEVAGLARRLRALGESLRATAVAQEALLDAAERAAALAPVLHAAGLLTPERESLLGVAAGGLRAALSAETLARFATRVTLLDHWRSEGSEGDG